MEASVPNRFRTEAFEFECELVSQMQHAALQINDHQVIRRRISQSFSDLVFEGLVPSFKISNMIWFHDSFESLHQFSTKKSGRAYGKVEKSLGYFLKRDPKASALLLEKPKPLKQLASPS